MANNNRTSLIVQEKAFQSHFPNGKVKRVEEFKINLEWEASPTEASHSYSLKLLYQPPETPKVFVTYPFPLPLANSKKALPHVYSTEEQRLCLYYPFEKGAKWDPSKLFVKTLIPWASEWLVYYEFWLILGEWYGPQAFHEKHAENT